MNCIKCHDDIESERLSVLPDTIYCVSCANKIITPRIKGYMEWSHKTAPVLRTTDAQSFAQFKKDVNRKGQSSILRSKMSNGGRLV